MLVGEVIEAGVEAHATPREPLELAVVREARSERTARGDSLSRWSPPTVTSIVLGRAEARSEYAPGGEGIAWLRQRQRHWPRRA